ncbi:LPS-assembly protein [Gemmobacter megaterium]|uniref:LPS-assembly protein LptD n=1 Tax=Gemmobacter megaterium TaxID=1086013 RepID=A0A1N7K705_9RHOB|nr:LPS assembly protein LptD [Gemmobacter megaterium]GGE00635.1 LPS-assembly protein LptD [Gemmobacter megaterium]SIS57318.1 LPS-assembly protein [Gemmobacter megaterium]
MPARPLAALILALGLAFAPAALAQPSDAATLVADKVQIAANRTLEAQGNVEVLYRTTRLRASRVVYDRTTGALSIGGPIVLTDDQGTVVLADAAELSDDLRDGILSSARLVMDRQMQIAATEMQRLGGRHTVLSKAVASSCEVCAKHPTPLWEIRARRIVHDQQERQIYFDSAQLRIAGVPVFWVPHLRMPDPTLDRASGFLMPRLVSTSRLGLGVQLPYFIKLGQSRDLTLTPFVASKDVQSLGFRYRQAFRTGEIALTGALSHDRVVTGRRGWLGAEGRFDLPQGFELRFAGETISDPAYFRDYGLSDKDRLDSSLVISRTRAGEHIGGRLVHVHSIRSGEVNATLPQLSADIGWTRRIALPGIGGTATLAFDSHAHRRASDMDMVGRDVARATLSAFWRRSWVGPAGILASVETGATFDLHRIAQDSTWPGHVTTVTPAALAELRWPWARVDGAGNSDVIEPVVQLVWSRRTTANHVPNEDSTLVEFDEGNLFGFSRFAGADRREGGTRVNAGLQWTRASASGWAMVASAGRVFRLNGTGQFTAASGLGGKRSDWVTALHLTAPNGTLFQGRAVFDPRFDLTRGEMRLAMLRDRYDLSAGWLWAEADAAENRLTDTSEWVLDGRLKLTDGWNARAATRHDFRAQRTTSAAFGLEFLNECMRVDMTVQRSFTSSSTVRPSTSFGVSVDLLGFGNARGSRAASNSCRY